MAADQPDIEVHGRHDNQLLSELLVAIKAVRPVLGGIAATSDVELPTTRWVVCEDFAREVGELIAHLGGPSFTTERLGGEVAAKTLRDAHSYDRVIALNGPLLLDPSDRRNNADHVFLAAHEMTHVLQEAVRRRSGVMESVPLPSETIRQGWRRVTRIVADEYRADIVAAKVLSKIASVTEVDGTTRPASIVETWALNHLGGAESVIVGLHPTLPDLIQSYRDWNISLDAMLQRLYSYTEQVATVLAHWQATCDILHVPDPWALGDIPTAPASSLYVRPLWEPICRRLREQPILPTPVELSLGEPLLLDVGEKAIEQLWSTLGVKVRDVVEGEHVDIVEPEW